MAMTIIAIHHGTIGTVYGHTKVFLLQYICDRPVVGKNHFILWMTTMGIVLFYRTLDPCCLPAGGM
jgi:hypothetical protein